MEAENARLASANTVKIRDTLMNSALVRHTPRTKETGTGSTVALVAVVTTKVPTTTIDPKKIAMTEKGVIIT